ncbi:tRNA uridine-5-carboxymethylaminomethyl(34) synthesis GTPase MnmE [Plasticicumulans acidivorans]|uniref:tRNA modification GTPase MnmE n=1 Tax=Plasticicumulans acidivorans TaxID=886464 RepID=A0A317MYQ8_9GAMM|nr:tRNA uridine-5-carboxymethylaminomethyl(34) synthesis GTPase MnmE [Plasticicumulans acidivorans]PWV64820.1 tRNA modification GTPase trmE [Plasticicumulans acidivorans]
MYQHDTIAAIATAPGRGGVGIVRVSGPAVAAIADSICGGLPAVRRAVFRHFRAADGGALDAGLVLYFAAPASFTGEPVLELQGHGGPVVLDLLLARACELGARPARPGEFSERAFLNGRLDLAQAEAIADLIDAATAQAARAALASLDGEFSRRVQVLAEGMIELRLWIESAIDFPEEEIDFLADGELGARAAALAAELDALMAEAGQGRLLREGMTVVIAGRPNAGKSSLLNRLAGFDAAIVTPIAGTTRDVLRERINLDGMPLHIIDTAGLRESADPVEQEGIRRAWREIERADRLLLLVDDASGPTAEDAALRARLPARLPLTLVRNKIDLSGAGAGETQGDWGEEIRLSALDGRGLDSLRAHLKRCMGYDDAHEGRFMARRRHLDALQRTREALACARQQLSVRAGELAAEELRRAHQALGEITGEFTPDDLLGAIFSRFCIGK